MTTDMLQGIDAARGDTAATPAAAPPDTANFRRLLESLEKLTKDHRQAPPAQDVQDTDQLQAALQRADQGFTTAMDLRRQLEDAFKARLT